PRVQLYGVRTHLRGGHDRSRLRINEERRTDPRRAQALHRLPDPAPLPRIREIEPPFRRDLLPALGDQRRRHRPPRQRELQYVARHRELEIHAGPHRGQQEFHVTLLDVPAVLPEMDRDPVSAAEFRKHRRAHRVRLVRPPGLPYRGYMVDVDVKPHHSELSRDSIAAARSWSSPMARASWSVSRPSAQYSARSWPDDRCRWRRTVSTSARTSGPVRAAATPRWSRLSRVPRINGSAAAAAVASSRPT